MTSVNQSSTQSRLLASSDVCKTQNGPAPFPNLALISAVPGNVLITGGPPMTARDVSPTSMGNQASLGGIASGGIGGPASAIVGNQKVMTKGVQWSTSANAFTQNNRNAIGGVSTPSQVTVFSSSC